MSDPAELRKYRIELPNLIDDYDMSVYAFRLYVHIKRVAGANGGSCHQGTRTLARVCHMSTGQIVKAKQELIEKGLVTHSTIKTNGGETDDLAPVDLWQENYNTYSKGVHTVNTTVQDTNTLDTKTGKGVHTVNEGVHVVNTGVHTVNERKNQRRKNMEEERETRAPAQVNIDSLHEGVATYKQLTGKRSVTPTVAAQIAAVVTDMPLWEKVVTAWCGKYRAENVTGMLDWYAHPDKMESRNGTHNNGRHASTTRKPLERYDTD